MSSPQEDVWALDRSDIEYERLIAEREWSRLNENFGNEGYKEGLSEGKDQTIESCFGDGFTEGGKYGLRMGELRGWLSTLLLTANGLNLEKTKLEEIKKLREELRQFKSDKMFSTQYFRKEGNIPQSEKTKDQSCSQDSDLESHCQKDDSPDSRTQTELDSNDDVDSSHQEKSQNNLENLPTNIPYANTFHDKLPAEIVREYEDKVSKLINSLNINISL
ncbi:hypothetical protein K7432_013207 [Basidiobolus ranarum]|uniref:Protein YAE1 n=1 Tax=Basidiobolus ranarum TaxID=34480 RepID=A0ABR2VRL3_9FUNG